MPGLWLNIGFFIGAVVAIAVVGPRLSRITEQLAHVTGIGATLAGALSLGASTSVPGHIISARTAYAGSPTIALGNAVGGIAAQTMFIALADVALRSEVLIGLQP